MRLKGIGYSIFSKNGCNHLTHAFGVVAETVNRVTVWNNIVKIHF